MINITTKENNLHTGKKFLYRSSPEKTISCDELYEELERYNSTVTKADAVSVFSAFTEVLYRLTGDGVAVNTPFGKFKATVAGGTDASEKSFKEGEDDNTINLNFYMSKKQKKSFLNHASYIMRSPKYKRDPFIDGIYIFNKNCDKKLCTRFCHGDIVIIHGEHFTFNGFDEGQGVYLVSCKDKSETKINTLLRAGSAIISFKVSNELECGEFKIKVVTKPSAEHIGHTLCEKVITISDII